MARACFYSLLHLRRVYHVRVKHDTAMQLFMSVDFSLSLEVECTCINTQLQEKIKGSQIYHNS